MAYDYFNNLLSNTASGANRQVLPGYGNTYLSALQSGHGETGSNIYATSQSGSSSGLTAQDIAKITAGGGLTPTSPIKYNESGYALNPYTSIATGYSAQAQPATQYPAAPTLDHSTPYVPQMSWDDAYTRASNMYDPQYDLSRQRTEKMYSDQRARLPQMLAARGYLKGGKREAGEHGITQEQAMALSELTNQFETQKQQAAYNIYSGESGRAQQTLSNLIAQQQAKNTDSMQQWQTQYGAALQKDMQDKLNSNALLRYFTEIFLNE